MTASPPRFPRAIWLLLAIALLALSAAWFGWRSRPTPVAATDAAPSAPADGAHLDPRQIESLGIQDEPAVATREVALAGLPAEALPPLDASTQVTVPYAGIAIRLLADEGDQVRRGQPLLRVQSHDLLAAQAEMLRWRSEAAAAGQQATRDARLAAEGIIPAAREEQSRARAASADASRRQAEGMLSRLRLAADGAAGEYEVLAPQDGRVLRRSVVPGQALEASAPVFVIADDSHLDIFFSVPVALRGRLRTGQEVSLPDGGNARVLAVGGDTDRASQSLRVRARTEHNTDLLAGQQFAVTLKMPAAEGALRVPRSALLPHGDRQLLYVREGDRYRGVVVEQLGHDDTHAVVMAASLRPGARVVTRGTSVLKSLAPVE